MYHQGKIQMLRKSQPRALINPDINETFLEREIKENANYCPFETSLVSRPTPFLPPALLIQPVVGVWDINFETLKRLAITSAYSPRISYATAPRIEIQRLPPLHLPHLSHNKSLTRSPSPNLSPCVCVHARTML